MPPITITGLVNGHGWYHGFILHFIDFLGKFDIGHLSQYFPTLIVGFSKMSEENSKPVSPPEQSITIRASAFLTILLAVIGASWGLFMLFMDSKFDGFSNEIKHTNSAIVAEVRNMTKLIDINSNAVSMAKSSMDQLNNKVTTIENALQMRISENKEELNSKMDQQYVDMLSKILEVNKEMSKLEASNSALMHGVFREAHEGIKKGSVDNKP